MTTKSPLEQAQARILALEAEVDRLASKRESNLESAERAMDKVERLMDERDALMDRATAAEAALRDLRATTNNQLAAILLDNGRLRTALLAAVKLYGQPGGPWNVPSEPGTWLAMAKEALGVVEGTAGEAGEG